MIFQRRKFYGGKFKIGMPLNFLPGITYFERFRILKENELVHLIKSRQVCLA